MATQDSMCSNEMYPPHQRSSSVRRMTSIPFPLPLPRYWSLVLGIDKVSKLELQVWCVLDSTLSLARGEEGTLSGSSMWSRKWSGTKCGSFDRWRLFFPKSSNRSGTILWVGVSLGSVSRTRPMTTDRVSWCPYHSTAPLNSQNGV